MIQREHYLSKIRSFYDSDLVKIITGIRRCGKSILLRQAWREIEESGKDCIFLDFDLKPTRNLIPDADSLIDYIEKNRKKEKCYVFFDEIQNVSGWSEACRTLRLQNCSVFITGSNSKLLSGEFTKELSGRYVSFRVRPFVFLEAEQYAKELGKGLDVAEYLIWGGFPAIFEQSDLDAVKRYLTDLNDTIIYNDLENRYRIRKRDIFERLVDYVLVSNARIFSASSVSDYLKGQNVSVSVPTVIKYLEYLTEAYVVNELPLYSSKAKARMSYYFKIYNEDVSFNSLRNENGRFDLTHNLENIVLNELYYRDYAVTVFHNRSREVDFRAEKNGKLYMVQVAYSVAEDKAYEREFAAFDGMDNSAKKILITNDEIDYTTSTVYHYKLKDFLRMEEL